LSILRVKRLPSHRLSPLASPQQPHQRHLRHRVEEVQADQLARIRQVVIELLEHDR
jgi:hypothetical protein